MFIDVKGKRLGAMRGLQAQNVIAPVHAPISALAHRDAVGVDAQLRELQEAAAGERPGVTGALAAAASLVARNRHIRVASHAAALAVTACGVHQDADGAGRAAERRLWLLRRLAALYGAQVLGHLRTGARCALLACRLNFRLCSMDWGQAHLGRRPNDRNISVAQRLLLLQTAHVRESGRT